MGEEKDMIQAPLDENDLEEVSGGQYVIDRKDMRFCPYCMKKHPIGIIRGKHRVGKHMYTLYWCKFKRQYFVKAVNGYFDIHDERLPVGTITVD
jgi:hypothetical protein